MLDSKQRPATAKLSFELFQQSGAFPGQWAQIYTDQQVSI